MFTTRLNRRVSSALRRQAPSWLRLCQGLTLMLVSGCGYLLPWVPRSDPESTEPSDPPNNQAGREAAPAPSPAPSPSPDPQRARSTAPSPAAPPADTSNPEGVSTAGWLTFDGAIGAKRFQFQYPPDWKVEPKPMGIDKAVSMALTAPRKFGPNILLTAYPTPAGFPTKPAQIEAKIPELLEKALTGMVPASNKRPIEELTSAHGDEYRVTSIVDESVPNPPTSPGEFRYLKVGVMVTHGYVVVFHDLHHEASPPEAGTTLAILRSARVTGSK